MATPERTTGYTSIAARVVRVKPAINETAYVSAMNRDQPVITLPYLPTEGIPGRKLDITSLSATRHR